jgi:hypothetical protein
MQLVERAPSARVREMNPELPLVLDPDRVGRRPEEVRCRLRSIPRKGGCEVIDLRAKVDNCWRTQERLRRHWTNSNQRGLWPVNLDGEENDNRWSQSRVNWNWSDTNKMDLRAIDLDRQEDDRGRTQEGGGRLWLDPREMDLGAVDLNREEDDGRWSQEARCATRTNPDKWSLRGAIDAFNNGDNNGWSEELRCRWRRPTDKRNRNTALACERTDNNWVDEA